MKEATMRLGKLLVGLIKSIEEDIVHTPGRHLENPRLVDVALKVITQYKKYVYGKDREKLDELSKLLRKIKHDPNAQEYVGKIMFLETYFRKKAA